MNKTQIIFSLFIGLSLFSCKKDGLENYLVQASENPDFLMVSLPLNSVKFDEKKLDKKTLKDIKSIKKFNILLYKNNFPREKKHKEYIKLQNILSSPEYKDLVKVKNKGYLINFKYQGNPKKIEQFIFLGKDKENNFMLGVLKINGTNINSIYKAIKHIDKVDNPAVKEVFNAIHSH